MTEQYRKDAEANFPLTPRQSQITQNAATERASYVRVDTPEPATMVARTIHCR